ncbi:MAG: hypothetical protein RI575_18595 [Balneolaceae bacterium]|nr:hypothetical protein [Balneolaceae bacterium]MDR9410254.1 hypothetical protein [Balneolaceae bacterium]
MSGIVKYWFFFLACLLLISACSPHKESEMFSEEEILARVGDEVITARDFQLNYEFGYPHLMHSDEQKSEYLDKMVAELVLAKEGYKNGFHERKNIQRAVQTITEERLIEEVFQRHVLSKIEVDDNEIREEVQKMAVSFKFSFLPAQSKIHGEFLRNQLLEKPFEEVVQAMVIDAGLNEVNPDQFRSDLTPALDIEPDLLEKLKNLKVSIPSNPIKYKGQWYIFIVENIIRKPLSPSDFTEKGVSARKIIYNRKAMEGGTRFVAETMDPLNVETVRGPFNALVELMYQWYENEKTPSGPFWEIVINKRDQKSYLADIYDLRDQTLVTTSEQIWSVQAVLEKLNTGRYTMRADNFRAFSARLADVIGLVIRDSRLLKIAEDEELGLDPNVKREIRKWQNKWVFREMRTKILEGIPFTDSLVFDYVREEQFYPDELLSRHPNEFTEGEVNRFRSDYMSGKLMEKANELKNEFEVEIYYERLDTLQISHSSANPNMTFQLLKQHNNRKPFPVLDPIW